MLPRGRPGVFRPPSIKSLAAVFLLALAAFVSFAFAGVQSAHADWNDDYPYSGGAIDAPDPWGFLTRECTSFAAWRLIHNNGDTSFHGPIGNGAQDWGTVYSSITDHHPVTGSVAWWSSGHVAWVESVSSDSSSVTIEEYNWNYNHNFNERTIAASNPTGYIHFDDITGSSSSPPPVPWNFENLDGDSGSILGHNYDLGQQPAEIQFGGVLHVFYDDAANGYLRHAWSDSSGWNSEVLDGNGGTNGRITANLGLTPAVTVYNNTLELFYYDVTDHALRHAWSSDGTTWNFETLDGATSTYSGHSSVDVGRTPSAVQFGTSLQVFYYDSTNGNLRHAWSPDGTSWNFENLDGDPGSIGHLDANLGQDPTSVVYNNMLELFYYDATNGNLRHAWSDSTGWHFENLDGDAGSISQWNADVGHNPVTLVYGTTLQVFYYDSTNGNLRHAWSDATGWHFENLDGDAGSISGYSSDVGSMPTATVYTTSTGSYLQLFYYEVQGGNLRHAWTDPNAPKGWDFETLDGTGGQPTGREDANVGYDPVAIQYGNVIELFYYDVTYGNLRHTWNQT